MENNNDYKLNNDKRNGAVTVAAIISALVFAILGLVPALWIGVERNKNAPNDRSPISRYLLVDAASELKHSMSALRLCNEPETAAEVSKQALVFAVRAETALECENGDFEAASKKEAFLNDVSTVLHSYEPMKAAELSDTMYKYCAMFYEHVSNGADFDYDGEIMKSSNGGGEENEPYEPSEEDISAAAARIESVLDPDSVRHIGSWDGRIEFELERNSVTGYAVAKGDRIIEFSFAHGGGGENTDVALSEQTALECAERCGYPDMRVYNTEVTGNYAQVSLCKSIDGALADHECALVSVVDGVPQAFRAGDCDCEHDVPEVKVDEKSARKAAKDAKGDGVLVTYNDGTRDRVCYEYRYELDDGVHYVYVCAENGKQAHVR